MNNVTAPVKDPVVVPSPSTNPTIDPVTFPEITEDPEVLTPERLCPTQKERVIRRIWE